MRNAFADEITQLSLLDPRIVLLSGDIGNKLFDKFKDVDGSRFYNCGIAEGNMMGVAAGMALSGLRPIVYTITPFTTTRCFEQIRVDVCYHKAPPYGIRVSEYKALTSDIREVIGIILRCAMIDNHNLSMPNIWNSPMLDTGVSPCLITRISPCPINRICP